MEEEEESDNYNQNNESDTEAMHFNLTSGEFLIGVVQGFVLTVSHFWVVYSISRSKKVLSSYVLIVAKVIFYCIC